VKDLIDQVVGRQQSSPEAPTPIIPPIVVSAPAGAPAIARPTPARSGPDRLILLTRTLAGLIDLILVAACTLGVLASTDFIAGLGNVDWMSTAIYSVLLILIFLLYSVYFLGTANQTIGMMITDLRVLGDGGKRPGFGQVAVRSAAFLISLAPAGAGLLWGCFDRDCRCWHDRLSDSRVVRLS
jgi:uncharacterized RDD family membrane protein YckC